MTCSEFETVAAHITDAVDYFSVFGKCEGRSSEQLAHIKTIYRRMATIVHPDKVSSDKDKIRASEIFTKLERLAGEARDAVSRSEYGVTAPKMQIITRRGAHEIKSACSYENPMCDIYRGVTKIDSNSVDSLFRVLKRPGDVDLFRVEASTLRKLRNDPVPESAHPFYPELLDSFVLNDNGKRRSTNVYRAMPGFVTLEQVKKVYNSGVNQLDMVWMWRKLLFALSQSHEAGIVHGAVLPAHIWIHPEDHGLILSDWQYSRIRTDGEISPIKAIVESYKSWYPKEVLTKSNPSAATDIDMAVKTMIWLLGGNQDTGWLPQKVRPELRAFFRGCLRQRQSARPQDAGELRGEFEELLVRMGAPFYPRRFRVFTMPTQGQ